MIPRSDLKKDNTYRITSGTYKDSEFVLEGLCKDVIGRTWSDHRGNPACLQYVIRTVHDQLPVDDNVYYGKIGMLGHLVHSSEIGEEIKKE